MPKAVKDHRSKKNSQSHESWGRRKQEFNASNTTANQFQRLWRIACIRNRMARGKFTAKNEAELASLDASYAVKRS